METVANARTRDTQHSATLLTNDILYVHTYIIRHQATLTGSYNHML